MKARLIALLGSGVTHAAAAAAVGCTESYVTQLLASPEVSEEVAALRFNNLQAASARDKQADRIEDALLTKLEEALPLMMRPAEILRSYAIINAAKRRGAAAPEQAHTTNQIIPLLIPVRVLDQFKLNGNNEIVEVGGRELITMTASQLLLEAKQHANNIHRTTDHTTADKQAA